MLEERYQKNRSFSIALSFRKIENRVGLVEPDCAYKPKSGAAKGFDDAFHFEFEEYHAGTWIGDVGVDGNLIDVFVIHVFEGVDEGTFFIAEVGEKVLL